MIYETQFFKRLYLHCIIKPDRYGPSPRFFKRSLIPRLELAETSLPWKLYFSYTNQIIVKEKKDIES